MYQSCGVERNAACPLLARVPVRNWPTRVYASRDVPTTVCTRSALAKWRQEDIDAAYWTYHRTDLTSTDGRRIYALWGV